MCVCVCMYIYIYIYISGMSVCVSVCNYACMYANTPLFMLLSLVLELIGYQIAYVSLQARAPAIRERARGGVQAAG